MWPAPSEEGLAASLAVDAPLVRIEKLHTRAAEVPSGTARVPQKLRYREDRSRDELTANDESRSVRQGPARTPDLATCTYAVRRHRSPSRPLFGTAEPYERRHWGDGRVVLRPPEGGLRIRGLYPLPKEWTHLFYWRPNPGFGRRDYSGVETTLRPRRLLRGKALERRLLIVGKPTVCCNGTRRDAACSRNT